MNSELMVTLDGKKEIKDFKIFATEIAPLLKNYFEDVNVEKFLISGVSFNKFINIIGSGIVSINYYKLDLSDEEIVYSLFNEINEIRSIVNSVLGFDLNNINLRLDFEYLNTINEITQKLQVLERAISGEDVKVDGINMKYTERIGGPFKVLEIILSYR